MTCQWCGIELISKRRDAKWCSNSCSNKADYYKNTDGVLECEDNTHWEYIKSDAKRLAEHQVASKRTRANFQIWLNDYKSASGCVDCGWNLHPAGLQLDHTGEKTYEFAKIKSSKKKFIQELENGKAEVRCANCHSIKTWAEKNGLPASSELYRDGKIANEMLSSQGD